jgi:hypothetical protein
VDRTTINASRVVKLYGTTARKGSNVPDRPHRRSALLEVPTTPGPVAIAALEMVAARAPVPVRSTPLSPRAGRRTVARGQSHPDSFRGPVAGHGLPVGSGGVPLGSWAHQPFCIRRASSERSNQRRLPPRVM